MNASNPSGRWKILEAIVLRKVPRNRYSVLSRWSNRILLDNISPIIQTLMCVEFVSPDSARYGWPR